MTHIHTERLAQYFLRLFLFLIQETRRRCGHWPLVKVAEQSETSGKREEPAEKGNGQYG